MFKQNQTWCRLVVKFLPTIYKEPCLIADLESLEKRIPNLEKKSKANDSLLALFAENHLEIYLGKNKIRLVYLGYEIKEEAVWFYLEAITKIKSKELKVINRLLCASVQGQSNVIHCTYDQSKLSYKLNCPEQEYVFRF